MTASYVLLMNRITMLPVSPNEYGQHPTGKLQMRLLFPPTRHQANVQHQHCLILYPSLGPFEEAEMLISNQLTKIILNDKAHCAVLKLKNLGAYNFVAVI